MLSKICIRLGQACLFLALLGLVVVGVIVIITQ